MAFPLLLVIGIPLSGTLAGVMSQIDDLTTAKKPGLSLAWGRRKDVLLPLQPPMSVVKSIEFVLPKDAIYKAGSCLKGQVILTLNSTLVHPIVKVELVGRGYIEWNEEVGADLDYNKDVICNNKEDYVHKTKTFPVPDNWLSAGSHTFDFRFNLPPRLPSTFTSKIGHIFYYIQASCAGRELILATKRIYLLVQGTSDFYKESPFQNPLLVEAEKRVSYNCCSRGTVHLQVSLERSIFAPGDRVVFTTEIDNQTSKCIKKVLFTLYTHVQYQAFTPQTERRTLTDSTELLRQEANTYVSPFDTTKVVSTFHLPLVLSVSGSHRQQDREIMSTRYELVVTIHLPWSLTTIKAKAPIVITTCRVLEAEEPDSQN